MSKQSKSVDKRARNAGLGLVALVTTVIGVGVYRSRKQPKCELVEDSVYRGFRYRIELCPDERYRAEIPAQTVGELTIVAKLEQTLASQVEARRWVHQTLHERLGGTTKATFVGVAVG
jgi:hypothetical protein